MGTQVLTVAQLCGRLKWDDVREEEDGAALEAKNKDKADTSAIDEQSTSTLDTQVAVRTRRHSGLGVLRWRLAIMLYRFPQLRYHRAHYLARVGAKKPNYWKQDVSREDRVTVTDTVPPLDVPNSISTLENTAEQVAARLMHR